MRRTAVAAVLALGLALGGCSDGGDLEELVVGSGGSVASSSSSAAPSSSSTSTAPSSTTASTTTSTSSTTIPVDEEVEVGVLDLQVGQCFEEPTSADEVETVLVVPCTTAHTYEVYAVWELAGAAYPGDDVVLQQADAGCLERFAPYVGADYAASSLAYAFFYPLEREWTSVGDRGVACFAYRSDGAPLTATVAGSGL